MSYHSETSLINYLSKYIGYTFYSETLILMIKIKNKEYLLIKCV